MSIEQLLNPLWPWEMPKKEKDKNGDYKDPTRIEIPLIDPENPWGVPKKDKEPETPYRRPPIIEPPRPDIRAQRNYF
tara:strand:+ start:264 stop:494 length:231 start_codon:yes stop_codon:yes gene_type:complete